jgi:hypothetical protein
MVVQLTYELKDSDRDYSNLYACIESLGPTVHFLRDAWWIVLKDNSTNLLTLVEKIKENIGPNDLFQLVDITDMQSNGWLAKSSWDWLRDKSNISQKNV